MLKSGVALLLLFIMDLVLVRLLTRKDADVLQHGGLGRPKNFPCRPKNFPCRPKNFPRRPKTFCCKVGLGQNGNMEMLDARQS